MNTGVSRFLIVIAGILSITAAAYPAAYAADFSADMVGSSPQGAMSAKMYVSGDKSRVEMAGAVTINRMDKKVMWLLMPQEKMYIEQPVDMKAARSTREKVEGEVERTVEGREAVNGMNTTKYRVTYESNGLRETIFQWIDDVNRFPVKTAAVDGSWSSEFRNISTKSQDPALFEVPSGYKKMSIPTPDLGALMKAVE